jgi:Domain of unknown function (DUF4331)
MTRRRLTKAVLSAGIAAGLVFGTTGAFGTAGVAAAGGLPSGGKTFVGPADDPFFIDLGAVFDGINLERPSR